ncbi:MAG: nitrate reductase NapE component [Bradymonadia bacterium]|jgi:nitrate reductase NapE component
MSTDPSDPVSSAPSEASSQSASGSARWVATLFCAAIASAAAIACAIGWLDVQTAGTQTGNQLVAIGGTVAAIFAVLTVTLRPGRRADEWKKLIFLAIGIWPFATFGLFIGWRIAVAGEQLADCEAGYAEVCTTLAVRKERRGKTDEAGPLFERACEMGHAEGCLRLAVRSVGVLPAAQIDAWFAEACEGDLAIACVRLARRLRDVRPSEALRYLTEACDLDDASACAEAAAMREPTP